jgi:hypothetical protein
MKRGRKKPGNPENDEVKPENVAADNNTAENEGADALKPVGESAASGQFMIDGIRALQTVAIGIAIALLIWLGLRTILHII